MRPQLPPLVAAAVLFILVGPLLQPSGGTPDFIFGPREYWRTAGAPNQYTDTFRAVPGQGRLVIENGSGGARRVSSARRGVLTVWGEPWPMSREPRAVSP